MKKAHILICDDESGVRESLKLILEEEYTLAYATNGEEAVEYVKKHDPDIAILDIKMPRMNGMEALRQVKKLKPKLKVLMITGYESSDVATQMINLGADDYLTKPFDSTKVTAQVRGLLAS